MRHVSCLRSISSRFVCRSGSKRPYSFTREIQSLLNSLDDYSSVPPVSPATRDILSEFHRKVVDARVTTSWLTARFKSLQQQSSLRSLPAITASAYLRRLLKERDSDDVISLLLEYNLDEAVSIAKNTLDALPSFEAEHALFIIYRGLLDCSQKGLGSQILAEAGLNRERLQAFKKLLILQERIVAASVEELSTIAETGLKLSKRLRGSNSGILGLDSYTALLLMKRSLKLNQHVFSRNLCRANWHALEALQAFFMGVAEDRMVQIAQEDSTHGGATSPWKLHDNEIWLWMIDRITTPEVLLQLIKILPQDDTLHHRVVLKAATMPQTLQVSVSMAKSCNVESWPAFLYEWAQHLVPFPRTANACQAYDLVLATLGGLSSTEIAGLVRGYQLQICHHTDTQLHMYKIESLLSIAQILNDLPLANSAETEVVLSKNFKDRDARALLDYFVLSKTSLGTTRELLMYRLHSLTQTIGPVEQDDLISPMNLHELYGKDAFEEDDMFHEHDLQGIPAFCSGTFQIVWSSLKTSDPKCTPAELEDFYLEIIRNLTRLPSALYVLTFIKQTQNAGYRLAGKWICPLIDSLATLPSNTGHLTALFWRSSTALVGYDSYATQIARLSGRSPSQAMGLLQLMMAKGLQPQRLLLSDLMRGISRSRKISANQAFKYLEDIRRTSDLLGYSPTREQFASYLHVVLVRQGLGAATSRILWLIETAKKLPCIGKSRTSVHAELVDLLRRWQIHESTRGSRGGKRPKRLRELIESLHTKRHFKMGHDTRRRLIRMASALSTSRTLARPWLRQQARSPLKNRLKRNAVYTR